MKRLVCRVLEELLKLPEFQSLALDSEEDRKEFLKRAKKAIDVELIYKCKN